MISGFDVFESLIKDADRVIEATYENAKPSGLKDSQIEEFDAIQRELMSILNRTKNLRHSVRFSINRDPKIDI